MIDFVEVLKLGLPALASIIAIVISNKGNTDVLNIRLEELEKRINQKSKDNMNLISTQIENLDEKVDKHNSVIERTYVVERDLKTAFHQLEEIKNNCKDRR